MRSKKVNPIFGLIVFGIIFAGIVIMACRALYLDEKFDQKVQRSQATVEHYWTTTGSKGSTHYHVRYHFGDEKGLTWTVNTAIGRGTYIRLHTGDIVPVKYLDGDPGDSRIDWPIEEQWHWHQDETLACVGLFMGALMFLIFASQRR